MVDSLELNRREGISAQAGTDLATRGISWWWPSGMTQAKSQTAFGQAAVSFEVHEGDYLLLLSEKIATFEAVGFRFPKESDFEEYLRRFVRLKTAYRDDLGEIVVYDRPTPETWDVYKCSEDCGCLRKLYGLSAQIAKKELEALASGHTGADDEVKLKVNQTVSQELEEKAIKSGMQPPLSDQERPSLYTLSKVKHNFAPGGPHVHLPWEAFIDADYEGRLTRAGKMPKDIREVVVSGSSVTVKHDDKAIETGADLSDLQSLREVLDLRARSFHMLGVAAYQITRGLTDKYFSRLREVPPEGMRRPTVNEARKTDRLIFQEVLKWTSKGKGSVEDGISYYLNNMDHNIWKNLIPQVSNLPDQGIDRPTGRGKVKDGSTAAGSKKEDKEDEVRERSRDRALPEKKKICLVCKKRHEPLCKLPENFRKEGAKTEGTWD